MSDGPTERSHPTYRVEFKPTAAKALRDLDQQTRRLIADRVEALALDPRPKGSKKLKGDPNAYRVRSGEYRILYEIHDGVLLVLVVEIGNRRDVYRKRKRRKG